MNQVLKENLDKLKQEVKQMQDLRKSVGEVGRIPVKDGDAVIGYRTTIGSI